MASVVHTVGGVEESDSHVVRIVHISDTHLRHDQYVLDQNIPDGDILVHSGDFSKFSFSRHFHKEEDYLKEINELNKFFDSLPHKYKIFVAGNHETNFPNHRPEQTARLLTSCIYLQDSLITIKGIRFYGSPWNGLRHNSFARGFSSPYSNLLRYWRKIPDETDILITHNPPLHIFDLGSNKHVFNVAVYCNQCNEYHKEYRHFGCPDLRNEILNRIRPKVHLFGHAHEPNGTCWQDGILFSNAAFAFKPHATVIDYFVESKKMSTTNIAPHYHVPQNSSCTIQ